MNAKKTTDYDIFKKHTHNRELVPNNILRIMRSIRSRNLLEHRPIMVNKNMEIIDGQHRLEAAKRLGVEIWYVVKDDVRVEDIHLLNNAQAQWNYEDYLNFFCAEGNENYIKIRDFKNKHGLSIRQALTVLERSEMGNSIKKLRDVSGKLEGELKPFKTGKFIFPSPQEVSDCVQNLQAIRDIQELIASKTLGSKAWLQNASFIRSLYMFLRIKEVDLEIFKSKIEKRMDFMRPCASLTMYLEMFKSVYNWRAVTNRVEIQ